MVAKKLRTAVVGTGDFGQRYVSTIASLPEFELAGVVDRDGSRARTVAKANGVPAFANFSELLEQIHVDAVVIATPPAAHFDDLLIAVERDIPVLVEKPVVASRSDLQKLELLSDKQRGLVLPAHISRYLPSFAALRQRLHGEQVRAVRAVRYVPAERVALHGESHPSLSAMVHDFDLIRALVPSDLVRVTSEQSWIDPSRPHPQAVFVHLAFTDGTVASVDNLWTMPHTRQYIDARLEVSSDNVYASLSLPSGEVSFSTAEGNFAPAVELEGSVFGVPVGALATQLRYFAMHAAGTATEKSVTLEDALWSVHLALKVEEQGRRP
ncbi:Gfo/Idh/MocA family protein [uncultured Arthrobacter sp.]|uniref:Gfo/Idh/MocA family protein n=1 Tax=uncultured Arthrobacter sp. TaxID=114050 RepID=UPI002613B0A6|nr:Gfo/Idh/MocA family oxidoreductase [uncultured Arthrobacter sp.]